MQAIKFIQQHGVDKAREVVEGAHEGCTHYRVLSCGTRYTKQISISECYIWNGIMWRACSTPSLVFTSDVIYPISELNRILEGMNIIEALGGIEQAKLYIGLNDNQHSIMLIYRMITSDEIKQAIADYEQLFGNTETLELETLRDCDTTPNCKKFERVK